MNVRWLIQINEVVSEVSSLVGNSVLEIHLINSVIYMNPFFGKNINLKFYKHDLFLEHISYLINLASFRAHFIFYKFDFF